MAYTIEWVHAREVLDSRGNPTVEVEVTLDNGIMHRALVPSWASTWVHEALELRDGDKSRYLGKWTLKAVANVNTTIASKITGQSFEWYRALDRMLIELDGTPNKSNLGANAILGVSMAFVGACAKTEWKWIYEYLGDNGWVTLPFPMMNILNGGSHADNNVDIQEFMIIPNGLPSFHEGLRCWAEVFHNLKSILKSRGLATSVGDEWGFAPNLALLSVPSNSINVLSNLTWSYTFIPTISSLIVVLTFSTAFNTPFPKYLDLSPSLNSTASKLPVDAPDGTIATPEKPPSVTTSTWTVGFPLESNTSKAFTSSIAK